MGPEVRFKSARRCQGYQKRHRNRCIDAAVENQRSFWDSRAIQTFFQFLSISGWELFMRYGSPQALRTHTDLITVIAIHLFTSNFVTVIKFVDFKPLLFIVINQFITVVITILVLHYSSVHFGGGESQTHVQRFVAKVMEFSRNMESSRSAFSPPSVTPPRTSDQWKPSAKRGIRGLRH